MMTAHLNRCHRPPPTRSASNAQHRSRTRHRPPLPRATNTTSRTRTAPAIFTANPHRRRRQSNTPTPTGHAAAGSSQLESSDSLCRDLLGPQPQPTLQQAETEPTPTGDQLATHHQALQLPTPSTMTNNSEKLRLQLNSKRRF